jgi:hypothetical protein
MKHQEIREVKAFSRGCLQQSELQQAATAVAVLFVKMAVWGNVRYVKVY